VHTYTFAGNEYFVGLQVIYQKNSSGFKIPMELRVFKSTELVKFDFPALQNMMVTVGDLNPTAYHLSTVWQPDTGVCDTVGHTDAGFWGGPP